MPTSIELFLSTGSSVRLARTPLQHQRPTSSHQGQTGQPQRQGDVGSTVSHTSVTSLDSSSGRHSGVIATDGSLRVTFPFDRRGTFPFDRRGLGIAFQGFAGQVVVVRVQSLPISRCALEGGLGFLPVREIGAITILRDSGTGKHESRRASKKHYDHRSAAYHINLQISNLHGPKTYSPAHADHKSPSTHAGSFHDCEATRLATPFRKPCATKPHVRAGAYGFEDLQETMNFAATCRASAAGERRASAFVDQRQNARTRPAGNTASQRARASSPRADSSCRLSSALHFGKKYRTRPAFSEGYSGGVNLAAEAIRLAQQVTAKVDHAELADLLALMLLQHAGARPEDWCRPSVT